MGKRKRDNARRMQKRPKHSPGSSSGGGGPARRTAAGGGVSTGTAVPPTPSSVSPSLGGGTPTGTAPPSTASFGSSSGGVHAGTSSSGSSGSAVRTTPLSTSSSSGRSGGGGGGTTAASILNAPPRAPPTFLTRRAAVPTIKSQYDNRYAEAEDFLTHLETHCKEAADDLWSTNKWHLKIDFTDFRRINRQLSHSICNNYEDPVQSGKDFYKSAMRTFLLQHFQAKSLDGRFESAEALKMHLETHSNLSFTQMPNSITTFAAIKKSRKVDIFPHERNIKMEAIQAVPSARILLSKIIDHILTNHKKGKCWNGNWSLDDWEIINDSYVSLLVEPVPRTGRSQSDKDLVKIANTVLPSFKLAGCLPSFMTHLQDELNNLPTKLDVADPANPAMNALSDEDFFGWFYTYLRFHPAMMSALARSNLLQGFYFSMDKLDYRKRQYFDPIFQENWVDDWRIHFHPPSTMAKVPYDVFWHKKIPCSNIMPLSAA